MAEHMPWVGSLSVDLRKGALSVSADGLTVIDEDGVCWGIVFPDKRGHYDHATAFVRAVNNHDALVKALTDALCELTACANQLAARGLKGHPDDSVSRAQTAARAVLGVVGGAQ